LNDLPSRSNPYRITPDDKSLAAGPLRNSTMGLEPKSDLATEQFAAVVAVAADADACFAALASFVVAASSS
jgi:hypothetical protein